MALFPFSRSRSGSPTAPDERLAAATAADVEGLYRSALGRRPSAAEVALQLAHAPSLRDLVATVLGSEEFHARVGVDAVADGAAPPRLNVHVDGLEEFGVSPGTWSPDGVAVVGRRGWVFLGSGSNAILDQYRGLVDLPADFDERWAAAMAARRAGAEALGAAFVGLIVPDKLPVLAADFPGPLPAAASAPAARLAARPELGLLYPVAALAAVPGDAYLRTDTHLTYGGNVALALAVGEALGVTIPHELAEARIQRHVISGDLGSRFAPPIVEVVVAPADYGAAEVVESNRDAMVAAGAHVGMRVVLRNEGAADGRTVVVFGDSYGDPARNYQGLAWFLAQAFREVHFAWVPFGWDPDYAAAAGAGVIVCQGAERFAIRPPELRVDVAELEAQVLGRARP